MPSCVLRVSGADFAVDEFLKDSTLPDPFVYRRGEPRTRGSRRLAWVSGFNCEAASTENDIAAQAREAVEFIRSHRAELARARAFPGVEQLVLDFATLFREVVIQSETLPAELIAEAASVGMEIEISLYPRRPSPRLRGEGGRKAG